MRLVTMSGAGALIDHRGGPRYGPPASSSEGGYAPLGLPRPSLGRAPAQPTSHAVPSTPSGIARRRRSRISGPRSSTIGVHTVPGAIALTRIAFGASWFATLTTKPRMPALAAAYAVPQAPRTAATDDTHVTAPPPRRSRAGTAAWVASSIDLRSTAITRSHSSSVVSISVWRDS